MACCRHVDDPAVRHNLSVRSNRLRTLTRNGFSDKEDVFWKNFETSAWESPSNSPSKNKLDFKRASRDSSRDSDRKSSGIWTRGLTCTQECFNPVCVASTRSRPANSMLVNGAAPCVLRCSLSRRSVACNEYDTLNGHSEHLHKHHHKYIIHG